VLSAGPRLPDGVFTFLLQGILGRAPLLLPLDARSAGTVVRHFDWIAMLVGLPPGCVRFVLDCIYGVCEGFSGLS